MKLCQRHSPSLWSSTAVTRYGNVDAFTPPAPPARGRVALDTTIATRPSLIRPTSGTDSPIERVRREIGTVRPHDRAEFGIDRDLREAILGPGLGKDASSHAVKDPDIADEIRRRRPSAAYRGG